MVQFISECYLSKRSPFPPAYLDEINNLQDPDLFYTKIKEEAQARLRPSRGSKPQDPLKDAAFVASVVANR